MAAYYNEFDPYAAQWLRNLIAAGHIADGFVDERSILDVKPADLIGYTQCHFFAGLGGWSRALRLAGIDDDTPVWTGSCPCQPFSSAGEGAGFTDERHLWPAWHHLITQCQPERIYGEQVASKDALVWLDLVHTDMEAAGYAFAAIDTCSAGVGAPHIRQRLYFVADLQYEGPQGWIHRRPDSGRKNIDGHVGCSGAAGGMDDTGHREHRGRDAVRYTEGEHGLASGASEGAGAERFGALADAADAGPSGIERAGPVNGIWRDADWLFCRDGKWRPVRSGTFPLANGVPGRVGRLRAYGNAINAEAATQFIAAYLDN